MTRWEDLTKNEQTALRKLARGGFNIGKCRLPRSFINVDVNIALLQAFGGGVGQRAGMTEDATRARVRQHVRQLLKKLSDQNRRAQIEEGGRAGEGLDHQAQSQSAGRLTYQ